MKEISNTLRDRGKVYGPYGLGVMTRSALMDVITETYRGFHGESMSKRQIEYFWDICNKLSRLAISPDHPDSWHDIQGYAKLIEDDITGEYSHAS